jgi:hypothetical protein
LCVCDHALGLGIGKLPIQLRNLLFFLFTQQFQLHFQVKFGLLVIEA